MSNVVQAHELIAENKAKHAHGNDASFLDIGKCGLRVMPYLGDMEWLDTLVVSNRYWDWRQRKWTNSNNYGASNFLSAVEIDCLPSNLITLYLGGDNNQKWEIKNWDFLKNLTQLQSLDLNFNQITNGDFLKNLTQLKSLSLIDNQIRNWDFLKNLTQLHTLDLSFNYILDLTIYKLQLPSFNSYKIRNWDSLKNLTQLQSLILRFNQIENWDFLKNLTQLHTLDLSSNKITNGDFLKNLNQLQTLYLSSNQITNGDFLKNLTQLQSLDLSSNQITDLEPILPLIKKGIPITLKEYKSGLNLHNNPITNPPLEIVQQGNEAIIRYFEELQNTKAEDLRLLNEAKLIVIGQPRAGKTSLRYKLCDTERQLPEEDESTRGIDIELQDFQYQDEKGASQNFQYHIWDFGGQQIYHATHRFFLTKRTVYVAVVNTDVNDKENDLDYWLHMIELMGDGSPVLLVQNQKNDRSVKIADTLRNRFRPIIKGDDYELNLGRLRKADNPKFDAQKLRDFQIFKQDIETMFARQQPILMTKQKSETRQALEKLSQKKPFIEFKEYQEVCVKNGLNDELAQGDLLRTLHNLGICLWYEGIDFLDRIVILQNRWATDAVFKVLDNEVVKKNQGHFQRAQLKQIWSAAEYQGRDSELVELMKRFKLCYQIGDTNEYIAPQLLDKNPPADFKRESIQNGGVRMLIEYEFMPRGIMTQFIVAMHKQITGGQRHAWETGFAVAASNGLAAQGLAEESYDSRKLELWAMGPGAALLLQEMLKELEKIHDSYNRLQYSKMIPCVCEHCSTPGIKKLKEFEYEEILLEMYQNRQEGMRCSFGNQVVSFERLMGGLGFTSAQMERDYRRGERNEHFPTIEINVNLPEMEKPEKGGDTYHVNVQNGNIGNVGGEAGDITQINNAGPSGEESKEGNKQNLKKMNKIAWFTIVGLFVIILILIYKNVPFGVKAGTDGVELKVDTKEKTSENTTPALPSETTVIGSILINGRFPKTGEVKGVYIKGQTGVKEVALSGEKFKLYGVTMDKSRLVEIGLKLKVQETPETRMLKVPVPDADAVADLGEVLVNYTIPKPSKGNGGKSPAIKIEINNNNVMTQNVGNN